MSVSDVHNVLNTIMEDVKHREELAKDHRALGNEQIAKELETQVKAIRDVVTDVRQVL